MQLQKYDVLIVKDSKRFIPRLIQWFTKDKYSHAMIVLDDNHILEATYPRVRIKHIDFSLGEFDAFRYKSEITQEQQESIKTFFQQFINSKYDIKELVMQAFNKEDRKNKKNFICITLIIEAFRQAGVKVDPWKKGFKQVTASKYFIKVNE